MSQYRVSEEADGDLINIWLYISENSQEAADRTIDELVKRFEMLAQFPEAGRDRDELAPAIKSFPVGKYVVFYRLIPDGIEIARILHGTMDIESEFGSEIA